MSEQEQGTQVEATWAEVVEALVPATTQGMSPYRLADLATVVCGRFVRPQVVYSYVRQGFIPAGRTTTGKWVVKRADAVAWVAKYAGRNATGTAAEAKARVHG